MSEISDSTLMAYADGELDPALRSAVEARLAVDPAMRVRLAAFTQTGREELSALFDPTMREAVPARLHDAIANFPMRNGSRQSTAPRSGEVRGAAFGTLLQGLLGVSAISWARFALALLVGVSAGWVLSRATLGPVPEGGQAPRLVGADTASGALLLHVLESTPSGTVVSATGADGTTVSFKVVLSFLSRNAEYCRQYEMVAAGGAEFGGLACRSKDETWRIEVHTRAPAKGISRGGKSVPAGEENAVDAAVRGIMPETGEVLVGESEKELIRNRWRVKG
ncbi:MAG TPA: hypothetical protein VNK52_09450 [Hyphomicrobiaceae bacterium]|nr:hypothetical protein [Hyphomicrobiaceae bacterium]